MADEEIVQALKEKISGEPKLAGLPLDVSCEEGIVYLRGEAGEWEQVVTLGLLAAEISGVKEVVNEVWPKGLPRPKKEKRMKERAPWDGMKADVVIVGAGIVGAAIARELSRFELEIVQVEKEADVAGGTSKGGSAWVHGFAGQDVSPDSLKAKLCVRGNAMYDKLAQELEFPFKRPGLLAVITDEDLLFLLDFAPDVISAHSAPVEVIRDREEIFRLEPKLTKKAVGGLFFPTYGFTSPYLTTIALVENAVTNGVKLLLHTEVIDIEVEGGRVKGVVTDRGTIFTDFLINAAGLHADEIAEMAGAKEFTIHPRKGEMLIFDAKYGDHYSHGISPITLRTDPRHKGGGIALSVHGNLIWGPNALEIPYKDETSTTREGIEMVWEKFSPLLPEVPKKAVITTYAGVRAATYKEDFLIGPSGKVKGLINVAGIQSPGITAAPAIAEMVLEILRKEGLQLKEKPDFDPKRKAPPSFQELPDEVKEELLAKDPKYGHVVCFCETVTEGEVVEAIQKGATTLDGIKFRTRAGMGRCQGGFCAPRIIKILARELGSPIEAVTKRGGNSILLPCKVKELLLRGGSGD